MWQFPALRSYTAIYSLFMFCLCQTKEKKRVRFADAQFHDEDSNSDIEPKQQPVNTTQSKRLRAVGGYACTCCNLHVTWLEYSKLNNSQC